MATAGVKAPTLHHHFLWDEPRAFASRVTILTMSPSTAPYRSSVMVLALLAGLMAYKGSGAAAALRATAAANSIPAAGNVALVLSGPRAPLFEAFSHTASYLLIIGPALLFAILISGAVRAGTSPDWFVRAWRRGPIHQQVLAGVAGAPLMLCSCCVAPLFSAIYDRSRRGGPSLALALAAPSLNPAALALTFMLFQPRIAIVRVALAVIAVFGAAPLVARLAEPVRAPVRGAVCDAESARCGRAGFVRSWVYVAIRVVPLIVAGAATAMWLVQRIPIAMLASGEGKIAATALTSALVVPMVLPTFFEIPLAWTLMNMGAPASVVTVVLFAGPAINLSSLFTIWREVSWKFACLTAVAIGLLSCIGGLIV